LDVWPASLPITIHFCPRNYLEIFNLVCFDNILAALKHCDRVHQIHIAITEDYQWGDVVTAMQGPFPKLRSLALRSFRGGLIIPDTFLNGSAPCLQVLNLNAISFPSLPRLLPSTSDLTSLLLLDIPDTWYISPVTMATSLSALPRLESLFIEFNFPTQSQRRNRPVQPPTRFVLPTLTKLHFHGSSEYFEILAARIDAPLLDHFVTCLTFDHHPELVLHIPQTIRLFGQLKWPRPSGLNLAFNPHKAFIFFSSSTVTRGYIHMWDIVSERFDWQVISFALSLAQICSQIPPFRSSVNSLTITSSSPPDHDNMDPTPWLQLFHSFPSVQSLSVSVALEPFIAAALQGFTGESAAETLPSLLSLSIVEIR
jgi:hypothetical protein